MANADSAPKLLIVDLEKEIIIFCLDKWCLIARQKVKEIAEITTSFSNLRELKPLLDPNPQGPKIS